MPDNTLSTLEQIRIKVRRLTRTPSTAQMTDATINNYINTFVLYDFPAHLKTFSLRSTLVFYTEPYIGTYATTDIEADFPNKYMGIHGNAYVAGYKQLFSQDREQFFSLYPKTASIATIGTYGNAVAVNFTGTLSNTPILRNHVSFTSIGPNNVGLHIYDVPNAPNDGAGTFAGDTGAAGSINYTTGAYDITFNAAPANGETIYSQTVPYSAGRPTAILYYNNEFTFRPVPDQPYRVELEVDQRPSEMLADATMPELSQWWQYIAYGAAKMVFEDRMDMDSVNLIMPEFKQQEILVNRRTVNQLSKERTSTIYTGITTELSDFYK